MDILILLWLSFKIRTKALAKGEKPWLWIFRLISLFITTELVVAMFIYTFSGNEASFVEMLKADSLNGLLILLPSLFLALLSSVFVFKQLAKVQNNEEFNIEDNLIEEEKPNLDHFR